MRTDSNRGQPMTYAANLRRDRIIRFHYRQGARDVESAAGRAALQGKADTVRMIWDLTGRPSPDAIGWGLASPAYTLSVEGTAVLFALGIRVERPHGVDTNAIEHLLGTDSWNPPAKHCILEIGITHGFELPDTPVMALHRGRIDLLEATSRATRICSRARSTSPTSFRSHLPASLSRTVRRAHRCTGRRSCTSPPISTSWISPSGCSTVAWIRTSGRRSTATASAVTRRSSRPSSQHSF